MESGWIKRLSPQPVICMRQARSAVFSLVFFHEILASRCGHERIRAGWQRFYLALRKVILEERFCERANCSETWGVCSFKRRGMNGGLFTFPYFHFSVALKLYMYKKYQTGIKRTSSVALCTYKLVISLEMFASSPERLLAR